MDVCLTCGDKGYSNLFISCVQCQAAVHRYCVIGPPVIDEEPNWYCEFCVSGRAESPSPCRSGHISSIVDRRTEQKRAGRKRKKSKISPQEVGEPNCVVTAVNKTGSMVANLDQETKDDSANRKQVKLKENRSPLPGNVSDDSELKTLSTGKMNSNHSLSQHEDKCTYPRYDINANTNEMPGLGSGPGQLKCSTSSEKVSDKSGLLGQQNTDVLNSDSGVEVGNSGNLNLIGKNAKDRNPNDMILDKQVKLKESFDPLLVMMENPINHNVSIVGERINRGDDSDKQFRHEESSSKIYSKLSEGLGSSKNPPQTLKRPADSTDVSTDQQLKLEKYVVPVLSEEEDNINHNMSNGGRSSGDADLDNWQKNELSDDVYSKQSEITHRIENSMQANHAGNKVSGVEKTMAASDQQVDEQSCCDNSDYLASRKKKRLIIEMEFSDEEPVLVVANHPHLVADAGDPPLYMTSREALGKSDFHNLAQGSLLKSGPPRLCPMKADNHVLTQETCNMFANHVFDQPFPAKLDCHFPARPLQDTVWRGSCSITGIDHPMYFALEAHLSSKAHEKVHNAATVLPSSLHFEILPKHNAWPKSFEKSPPTSETIGLYFFPVDDRAEKLYVHLIEKMIEHGLALKCHIINLELLVFCSRDLPQEEWGINRKYYLWGVFKPRKEVASNLCRTEVSDGFLPLTTEYSSDVTYNRNNLETAGAISSSVGLSSAVGLASAADLNWSKRRQVLSSQRSFVSYEIKSQEIPKQQYNSRVLERCEADDGFSDRAKERECYDRVLDSGSVDEFSYHMNKQYRYNREHKSRRDGDFSYRANGWDRDNREPCSRRDTGAKERNHWEPRDRPLKKWKRQYKPYRPER